MIWHRRVSPLWLVALFLLDCVAAASPVAAASFSASTTSFKEWEDLGPIARMVYDPFDPALGTLVHVEVVVQGRVAQQLFGGSPGASPYSILFTQSISTDLDRSFVSAVPFEITFAGEISFQEEVQLEQRFQYIVTCEPSSNVDDLCSASDVTGFDNAMDITQMDGSLERFTDAGIYHDPNVPWQVYTANLFSGFTTDVFPYGEPLIEGVTHIEYRYEFEDDPVLNDPFSGGGLPCWIASPPGSVSVVEYPLGTGNEMMELSAGPVTIECDLGVSEKPAEIRYDSGFRTADGTLSVSLGGVDLATHLAGDGVPGDVTLSRIVPSDGQWAAATGSTLTFGLTGLQGAQALIDNVTVLPAPEPGAVAASSAALLTLVAIARRRRSL